MAKNIEHSLSSIKEYFDFGIVDRKRQLIIPEFQRAYSWEEAQCAELWNDIDNHYENSRSNLDPDNIVPYFFGCIIYSKEDKTVPINDEKTKTITEFKIIDGQQRTITFLLLIKAMELRVNEVLTNDKYDFSQDEELKGTLEGCHGELLRILYRDQNKYIRSKWDDKVRKSNNHVIITRSVNEVKKQASSELDLYKIFKLEKFEDAENANSSEKVSIISRQGLSKKSPKRFSQFYRNFKYFYSKLDKKPKELNDWINFFLTDCQIIEISSHDVGQAISMFNALNSKGMNLSDSDLVCSYLAVKAEKEDKNDPEFKTDTGLNHSGYFENKWHEFVITVHGLSLTVSGRNEDEREAEKRKSILNQYMYYVRACDGVKDTTTPGVRSFYNAKIEKEEKSKVNFKSGITCDALTKIAKIWENILEYPAVKILIRLNSNSQYYLISYLFQFAFEDITKERVTHFAEKLLRLFAIQNISGISYSHGDFKSWLIKNNTEFVKSNNDDVIDKAFNDHINNNTTFDQKEILENLKGSVSNAIVYLHEYLYAKEKNMTNFDIDATTEVEHIMPQSGDTNEQIRKDANIPVDNDDEFFSYLNKLGNKILLEANINKHLSAHWFKQKKESSVKQKAGYGDSKFPIATFLKSLDNEFWTKEDIDDATDKAASRIIKFIFQ